LLRQAFPDRTQTQQQAGQLAQQLFGHADWLDFDRGLLAIDEVAVRTSGRLDLPLLAMNELLRDIGERLLPMHETVALLAQLRGRRQTGEGIAGLYYLSNMPAPYARVLERKFEILQWFDGGIFSADVQLVKPEPAIYQRLQSRYALAPGRTLLIDDLLHNVEAARSLGWHGIHFESAGQVQGVLQSLLLI
jgi:putative hydrolase of the HAD superfamily